MQEGRITTLVLDASVDAPPPPPGVRGAGCTAEHACAEGLACGALPGGYCMSSCGVTGTPCDGACVETAKATGDLCAAACNTDDDCRRAEGYVCDSQWHACLVPNFAALVGKQCPGSGTRDAAFGPSDAWSTVQTPGVYQLEPSAVVTPDGGVTALYMTRAGLADGNVLAISRVDGKGARTDAALPTGRRSALDPWLTRDRKGTLWAAWRGFDAPSENQQIGLASSTDNGATWSTPIAANDPADCDPGSSDAQPENCVDKPMVVAGASDTLYVMYATREAGLRVRTTHDGGKSFGPTITALVGTYGNAAVGSDGKLHIVTINGGPLGAFGSAQQTIEYTQSATSGETFTQPVKVSGGDELLPFYFANPSIAVDTRRKWLYIAYVRGGRDAAWDIVLATSKDNGLTWKRHTLAGGGCALHMVPNLALDDTTGTLHLAYYDNEGTTGRFVHAQCAPGGTKCKVLGAISSQPFAALSTERNGAKWLGAYEALVVDSKRRMLHAVWTQPVGDPPIARIFHASAKLRP